MVDQPFESRAPRPHLCSFVFICVSMPVRGPPGAIAWTRKLERRIAKETAFTVERRGMVGPMLIHQTFLASFLVTWRFNFYSPDCAGAHPRAPICVHSCSSVFRNRRPVRPRGQPKAARPSRTEAKKCLIHPSANTNQRKISRYKTPVEYSQILRRGEKQRVATTKLSANQAKRDFTLTPEPSANIEPKLGSPLRFVVQKHEPTRLHYDLRLEPGGVFKSRAVTGEQRRRGRVSSLFGDRSLDCPQGCDLIITSTYF